MNCVFWKLIRKDKNEYDESSTFDYHCRLFIQCYLLFNLLAIFHSVDKILFSCHTFQVGFDTYDVPPKVNVGELLVDVLEGRLHAFVGEEGEPLLGVCAGLRGNEGRKVSSSILTLQQCCPFASGCVQYSELLRR